MVGSMLPLPYEHNIWGPMEPIRNHINSIAGSSHANFMTLQSAIANIEDKLGMTAPASAPSPSEARIIMMENKIKELSDTIEKANATIAQLESRLKDLPQSAAW